MASGKLCRCFLHLINFIFLALGLAVLIIGAYVWYRVGVVIAWMPIIVTMSGGVLMVVTMFGFCGAGYDKTTPNAHLVKRFFLLIYFFVVLIVGLILAIAATLCLVAWEKVKAIVLANIDSLVPYIEEYWPPGTPVDFETVSNLVMANLKICGGVGLAVAVVILIGILLAAYLLGYEIVMTHTLTFGNILLSLAGGILVALGIYVYVTGLVSGKIVPLVIGIGGVVVIVLATVGFFAACLREKKCCKNMLCIYSIILCLLVLLAIVCGIIAAAFTDTVAQQIDAFCIDSEGNLHTLCTDAYRLVCEVATCAGETNSTVIIDAVTNFIVGNMRMVAAGALWIGCGMVYLIVAGFIVRAIPPKKGSSAASKESIPSQHPSYGNYSPTAPTGQSHTY